MKKTLVILSSLLLLLAGCSNEEMEMRNTSPDVNSQTDQIRWYGTKLPDNVELRGVADGAKAWNPNAGISIKFINSPAVPGMIERVKEVAAEWEKYAGIKFNFVEQDKKAEVRIAFNWNGNDWLTWSYTGNYARFERSQSQPTAVFGGLEYLGETQFRGDVLRIFGQILGLEYEQRHQEWSQKGYWKSESQLRAYWEDMFDGFNMDWDEIREYVFDPLTESDASQYFATREIDELSIMAWPYYNLRQTTKPLFNYELSEGDKAFIAQIYPGASGGGGGGDDDGGDDDLTLPTVSFTPNEMKKKVVAHHGYWTHANQQNSLQAHRQALNLGIYGAQFDIWQTASEVVVSHEPIMGGWPIERHTFNKLRYENVCNANGEPIPMWGEFLDLGTDGLTKKVINLKAQTLSDYDKRVFGQFVAECMAKSPNYGSSATANMMSTHWLICKAIGELIPRLPAGNSVTYLGSDKTLQELKDTGVMGIGYNIDELKTQANWDIKLFKKVTEAHNLGMTVYVSTVNDREDMKTVARAGVDYISTDYPPTAINCFQ